MCKGCGTQNEWWVERVGTSEICVEQYRIANNCEEVSTWRDNCTTGAAWSRGMGYEKCWEKECECSWDEVFEKFGWIELGIKRCVGELE